MKKLLLLAALAVLAIAAPAGAATFEVVGTDPAGDWGTDPEISAAGKALGQDLTEAAIAGGTGEVLFRITVASLPETGGVPEITRYTWDMFVDGTQLELDGKFTNYTRGACDPTAGTCPPPRDPGVAPFAVRGNCTTTGVTTCQELGLVHATFEPATGTITIPVPHSLLPPCSLIEPGVNIFGGSISAAPSAFFTSSVFPLDTLDVVNSFTVPC